MMTTAPPHHIACWWHHGNAMRASNCRTLNYSYLMLFRTQSWYDSMPSLYPVLCCFREACQNPSHVHHRHHFPVKATVNQCHKLFYNIRSITELHSHKTSQYNMKSSQWTSSTYRFHTMPPSRHMHAFQWTKMHVYVHLSQAHEGGIKLHDFPCHIRSRQSTADCIGQWPYHIASLIGSSQYTGYSSQSRLTYIISFTSTQLYWSTVDEFNLFNSILSYKPMQQ
jgi:hypothetical protein